MPLSGPRSIMPAGARSCRWALGSRSANESSVPRPRGPDDEVGQPAERDQYSDDGPTPSGKPSRRPLRGGSLDDVEERPPSQQAQADKRNDQQVSPWSGKIHCAGNTKDTSHPAKQAGILTRAFTRASNTPASVRSSPSTESEQRSRHRSPRSSRIAQLHRMAGPWEVDGAPCLSASRTRGSGPHA
jgi:hypothetical protein